MVRADRAKDDSVSSFLLFLPKSFPRGAERVSVFVGQSIPQQSFQVELAWFVDRYSIRCGSRRREEAADCVTFKIRKSCGALNM